MLAHWTRALIRSARLDERARLELCGRTGIPPHALDQPRAPIASEAIHRAWEELTGDAPPGTGLRFADSLEPSMLGLVGYLAAASPTLLDALQRVVRHQARAKAPGSLVVTIRRDAVHIVDMPPAGQPPWPAALAEAVIGSYLALARRLSRSSIDALEVTWQHAPPPRGREHLARWLGCVPRFRAAVNALVLPRAALERPVTTHDPVLLGYLEPVAASSITGPEGPLPRVRALIGHALSSGERPDLASIARAMGTTSRTLQRRLADEGVAFSSVLDDVRHATASRLVDDPRLSRAELALLLGYRDASALGKGLRRMGLSRAGAR